jgi:dihydroneopterin aldolase
VRGAKRAFFPLDEQLGLEDKHFSGGILKEMVWLSGVMDSFAEAEAVFERIGQLTISDSSIWRRKEKWGEAFKAIEEAEREKANTPSRASEFRERVLGSDKRMGVSMDGTMVHIRDEGWKELKVGCSFDIEVYPSWNKEPQEWEDLAHAVNNRYVAHLGGPQVLGQLLWAQAKQRGWEGAADKEVVGDAAAWIWNQAQEHFYDARQAVDWYHALEHLSNTAALLYAEGTPAAKKWYKSAEKALYQGHAERIGSDLLKAALDYPEEVATKLQKEAAYLDTHKRRMQYLELREDGYVIGSGMVESGGKQFKSRFCGPGMRWNRTGIERLIPIRAAIMSGSFDTMWHAAYYSPQN